MRALPARALLLALTIAPPVAAATPAATPAAPARGTDAAPESGALTVAVAANLRPAFERIAAAWEARRPGVAVRATYGASVGFYSQIVQGAPFDVLLSADADVPGRLAARGLAAEPPFVYARGALVLWVPRSSPLPIEARGLAALGDPSVRRIAMANPQTAPYGRAAEQALRAASILDAVRPKLVLGQSVAQAAQFAQAAAADAALLPASTVRVPPLSRDGRWVAVPESLHEPIVQAGLVIATTRRPRLASSFAAFVRGPEARRILEDLGYSAAAQPGGDAPPASGVR